MSLSSRRRALMMPSGENLYYEAKTGCYYPKNLDITVTPPSAVGYMTNRYAYCSELETAVVRGVPSIGYGSGAGGGTFSNCPKLKSLILTDGCGSNAYIASESPMLENIQLGSIGHPVAAVYKSAFIRSGTSAPSKTITVYVDDSTQLPLANAPWAYTGASVVYRSATSGEVIEV